MRGLVDVPLERLSRRKWLGMSAALPIALVGAVACQENEFACSHTTGVTPQGIAIRQNLAYQDRSPNPEQRCDNCQQYVAAPTSGVCATCKVMPGPTHPLGTCKVWVKQA